MAAPPPPPPPGGALTSKRIPVSPELASMGGSGGSSGSSGGSRPAPSPQQKSGGGKPMNALIQELSMAIGVPKEYMSQDDTEYNPSMTRPGYKPPPNLPKGGTQGEEIVHYSIKGPTLAKVQALTTFELYCRNAAGELINLDIHILETEMVEEKTGDTSKGLIHPNGKGIFKLQYRGRNTGKYHFNIWVKGQLEKKPIFPGKGVEVEFTAQEIIVTRNMYFSASGFGLIGGSVGKAYAFNIEVKDDDNQHLDCDVYKLQCKITQGLKKIAGTIDRVGVGKYKAHFTPFGPGEMVVSLLYANETIIETTVTWNQAIDPSQTEIMNPPGHVLVGQQHTFTIQARTDTGQDLNVGGEKFDVGVSGPAGGTTGLVVRDELTGKYTVRFTLIKPGTYKFYISLSGADIIGSPMEIEAR
jgi:hypothetical protein